MAYLYFGFETVELKGRGSIYFILVVLTTIPEEGFRAVRAVRAVKAYAMFLTFFITVRTTYQGIDFDYLLVGVPAPSAALFRGPMSAADRKVS